MDYVSEIGSNLALALVSFLAATISALLIRYAPGVVTAWERAKANPIVSAGIDRLIDWGLARLRDQSDRLITTKEDVVSLVTETAETSLAESLKAAAVSDLRAVVERRVTARYA